jgi:3-oxoadipate enol-lactonase
MAFLETNGIRIHYELSGSAGLPVLVFSHSLGSSLELWEPQLAALAEKRRVLRYDTRGHGASACPAGPYNVDELGADVLGLLDALEIAQVDFCGLSMGGVIGQWLAMHAPQRLRRLALANTAAKIGTAEIWNARIATVELEGLDTVIPGTLERWFTAPFRSSHPAVIAKTEAMIRGTASEGYKACCAALRDADFRESAKTINVPTLLIAGTSDPVTTPADLRFLAGVIANSQLVELSAAHLSNVEAAEAFNQALLHFLA